jgi:lysophospholipase L1-like esterase
MPPGSYVALGDSMSIDLYPEHDARDRLGVEHIGLGAASLLFRNVDALWPEHAGRDLATPFPTMAFINRTSDGAFIDTVLEWQLAGLRDVSLATLTVGGNDLLAALALSSAGADAVRVEVAAIHDRYARLVGTLRDALPDALLVLATIYDPTDGTGLLPPSPGRLPIELLKQTNERIRALARTTPGCALADVQMHFMGHGVHAGDSWYWPTSPIEPSARGASEIRRVFWAALATAGFTPPTRT